MVDRLRALGIEDEAVLGAFGAVPRHRFVDSALATQAYEDTSLPIGLGQTISKPSVVARMLVLPIMAAAVRVMRGSRFRRGHTHTHTRAACAPALNVVRRRLQLCDGVCGGVCRRRRHRCCCWRRGERRGGHRVRPHRRT